MVKLLFRIATINFRAFFVPASMASN